MVWLEVVPSFLSAVASVGAAIAAFVSLRISKRSTSIAESTALAVHHNSASIEYAKVIKVLGDSTREFSDFSYSLIVKWSRELEGKDNYLSGGSDPRPLRHVLSNGSEMLAKYGFYNVKRGGSGSRSILHVIRHGIGNLSDNEYQKLLKKADGAYHDFEGVFGTPSKSVPITSSPAFRWVCYQLIKRVESKDWKKEWQEAWSENGCLSNYQTEFLKIKPILKASKESLTSEKEKLEHTAFPINKNPELSAKYDEVLMVLESLIEDCDGDLFDAYKDWEFTEELSQFILCSMATANFSVILLNTLYKNDY